MHPNSSAPSSFSEQFQPLTGILDQGVAEGAFPGAVAVVSIAGRPLFQYATGFKLLRASRSEGNPPMTVDTVFDVAGLTSGLVTTTLLLRLAQEGKVNLTDKVSRFLQGFGVHGKSKISIDQLLTHTSGLQTWAPFFEEIIQENTGPRLGIMTSRSAREYVYNQIQRLPLKAEPGTKLLYSDLGAILLGAIVELLTGLSLEKAAQKFWFQPLGLKSTGYVDLSLIRRRGIHPVTDAIAATEECPWRKRVLCGEVHDDNAWAMGGIAGHAGLFTNALDLNRMAAELIAAYHGDSTILARSTMMKAWDETSELSTFRSGWDTPSKENNLADTGFSSHAIGMNGFTGCSLWIEPRKRLSVALLTNRIHPSRNNKKINSFRQEFHTAVLKAL